MAARRAWVEVPEPVGGEHIKIENNSSMSLCDVPPTRGSVSLSTQPCLRVQYELHQYMVCDAHGGGAEHWRYARRSTGLGLTVFLCPGKTRVARLEVCKRTRILESIAGARLARDVSVLANQDWLAFSVAEDGGVHKFQVRLYDSTDRSNLLNLLRKHGIDVDLCGPANIFSQETLVEPTVTKPQAISVAHSECQSTVSRASRAGRLRVREPSVTRDLKANRTVQFAIDTYSSADVDRRLRATQRQVVWTHLGVQSGLRVSVVPADRSRNPVVQIQSKVRTLEEFVPSPQFLRVQRQGAVVALQYRTYGDTIRCVQFELDETDAERFCCCLEFFNVHRAGREASAGNDSTREFSSGFGTRYFSDVASTMSRGSRFWERRRRILGL